jgi:hypothetical protein
MKDGRVGKHVEQELIFIKRDVNGVIVGIRETTPEDFVEEREVESKDEE